MNYAWLIAMAVGLVLMLRSRSHLARALAIPVTIMFVGLLAWTIIGLIGASPRPDYVQYRDYTLPTVSLQLDHVRCGNYTEITGLPKDTNLSAEASVYGTTVYHYAEQHLCNGTMRDVASARLSFRYYPRTRRLQIWWSADIPVKWLALILVSHRGVNLYTHVSANQTYYETVLPRGDSPLYLAAAACSTQLPPGQPIVARGPARKVPGPRPPKSFLIRKLFLYIKRCGRSSCGFALPSGLPNASDHGIHPGHKKLVDNYCTYVLNCSVLWQQPYSASISRCLPRPQASARWPMASCARTPG